MKLISVILISSLLSLLGMCSAKKVFADSDKFKPLNIDKRGEKGSGQLPLFQEPPKVEAEYTGIFIPTGEEPQKGPTLLTSSISTAKDISVFAYYVRDNVEIASRFNDRKTQSIVFAPTNEGIEALSLKPWQFPSPVDEAKSQKEIDNTIASNLNDFILSHIIEGELSFSALDSQKGVQFVSSNGKNIKLVNDDGHYYVTAVVDGLDQEWLKVENVLNADNGAVLVISKPLSLPSA